MSDPYLGEIRMFGGIFAPVDWAFCDGSSLSISQNDALFSLIGTTYGGDGSSTFNLPDLRGRTPIHRGTFQGTSFTLGQAGGAEQVVVTPPQLPAHTHGFPASVAAATGGTPSNQVVPGSSTQLKIWSAFPATAAMNAQSLTAAGKSLPHENMMPFLAMSFIIALSGIFPSRS